MLKAFFLLILLFSIDAFPAGTSEQEVTAYSLLRDISRWDREIDSMLINFSLNYRDENNKIKKVDRRRLSFVKRNNIFSSFRYDLLHPEKLTILVSEARYKKYNFETKVLEEEITLSEPSDETKEVKKRNFLTSTHAKIVDLLKDVQMPGVTIPNNFRHNHVFSRARINQEVIYRSRQCYLIEAKSSTQEGLFWISKDNNTLMRYVITSENNSKEIVDITRRKKISDTLFIPLEANKIVHDEEGNVTERINIRYYGYMINRKLPPRSFDL